MRQGENFEDATLLATQAKSKRPTERKFWRGGLVETLATLRYRDEAAYEEWLEDRDTILIVAALSRLSDRQLARIGLSRNTLVIGIEDLKRLSERDRQIGYDALEIIGDNRAVPASQKDDVPARPMAAE